MDMEFNGHLPPPAIDANGLRADEGALERTSHTALGQRASRPGRAAL